MDISSDETRLARIADNFKRENAREDERIEKRMWEANLEIRRLVDRFLEIDPDIEKIVLFGSLAEGKVLSLHFDIDLAVRSEKYLQLVSCGLKSYFRVDVVDLATVQAHIRRSIENYGKILYEKKKS